MKTVLRQSASFLAGGLIIAVIILFTSQAQAQLGADAQVDDQPQIENIVLASTPRLKYQGQLLDNSGQPKVGQFNMVFTIYDENTVVKWQETHNAVNVNNDGTFAVQLGTTKSIIVDNGGNTLFPTGDNRYLGVTIGGEAVGSPELITYTPIATNSMLLDGKTQDDFAAKKFGAISFGVVNENGGKESGLHFSSSKVNTGEYAIEVKKGSSSSDGTYDYNLNWFTTVVTPVRNNECNYPTTATTNSSNGKLIVRIYRTDTSAIANCKFHFTIFWDGNDGG